MRGAATGLLLLGLAACRPPAPSVESPLDRRIPAILAEDGIPGAVLAWGERGEVRHRRAYGDASLDTIYDLASVTKAVGTATAVLRLVEQGRLGLEDPVSKHLPCFEGKPFTVQDLLRHATGLPAYLSPKGAGADLILEEISKLPAGRGFTYS